MGKQDHEIRSCVMREPVRFYVSWCSRFVFQGCALYMCVYQCFDL